MTMAYATLKTKDEEGLRWIRFDRARKMNAFDEHQWTELGKALDAAAADDEVRCIALGSTSAHFSSGYDLPAALIELEGAGPAEIRRHIGRGNQACWKVWHSGTSIIVRWGSGVTASLHGRRVGTHGRIMVSLRRCMSWQS